jgi:dihydrofolate synthase/folylpolyglutamate synthase
MTDPLPVITDHAAATGFLDARIGRGVKSGLERITGLLDFMADPHLNYPIVHVAGTNGKTTVTRLVSDILGAHGLITGTFISPHLHRVEERFSVGGSPLAEDGFVDLVAENAWIVEEYERRHTEGVTYFEVTAALAFATFAQAAVDVAVVEVGLGGRWDATNVVDAAVSVITGIAMDHVAYLGDSIAAISAEKAAVLKEGGLLVTGPLPAAAEGSVTAQVAATDSRWFRYGDEFTVGSAVPAVGGWSVDVAGVYAEYPDLYLPFHGRHQVDNLATAIASAEAFLEHALDLDALTAALAAAVAPARIEVVHRRPLVVVDGAHNEQGLSGLAATIRSEFPATSWGLVVGMRGDRDVATLLAPFAGLVDQVWATEPDDPAAIPASMVAAAAAATLEVDAEAIASVPKATSVAIDAVGSDGAVIVTGSLYVAAEAREALIGTDVRASGVHVRIEAEVEMPGYPDDDDDDDESEDDFEDG